MAAPVPSSWRWAPPNRTRWSASNPAGVRSSRGRLACSPRTANTPTDQSAVGALFSGLSGLRPPAVAVLQGLGLTLSLAQRVGRQQSRGDQDEFSEPCSYRRGE